MKPLGFLNMGPSFFCCRKKKQLENKVGVSKIASDKKKLRIDFMKTLIFSKERDTQIKVRMPLYPFSQLNLSLIHI